MKTKIKLQLVSIQGDGYHLFFNVKVNNNDARFLIDTGASRTVLDKAFVNTLPAVSLQASEQLSAGLGTNTIESEHTEISSMKIGSIDIRDINVAVIDLSHVNQTYRSIGLPELNGVLGGDLLSDYKAIIDYKKRRMTLKKKKEKKKKTAVIKDNEPASAQ